MRITQITPGTGSFFCGSCLRDHAAAVALRKRGHEVSMLPLYLPFVLEETLSPGAWPRLRGERIFMGGINVYLQQKVPILRHMPVFLRNWLDRPGVLAWLSTKGDMTSASKLGAMTLSMLRGEAGRQKSELNRFTQWMQKNDRSDVIVLSNALLAGIAKPLRAQLNTPIACTLHGEDSFLDSLPQPWRTDCWTTLRSAAKNIDHFIAVSEYYGSLMRERLELRDDQLSIVHNGIDLSDFDEHAPVPKPDPPTVGYLARMCEEKGIHVLVDAFILLKQRSAIPNLKLRAAGAVTGSDSALLKSLKKYLDDAGCANDASFAVNVEREEKLELLRSISLLSVPATYGESFGLYIIEALAAGVPVVQPRHAAFPELIEATGGGVLCEPDDPESLADAIESLLLDDARRVKLGTTGRTSVFERFHADRMATDLEAVYATLANLPPNPADDPSAPTYSESVHRP